MKHNHKYHRLDIGATDIKLNPETNRKEARKVREVWVMKCSLPGCSHYTRMSSKRSAPLLVGRFALCNICSETFVLTTRALRQAKPTCDSCSMNRKSNLPNANRIKERVEKGADFFEFLTKEFIGDKKE